MRIRRGKTAQKHPEKGRKVRGIFGHFFPSLYLNCSHLGHAEREVSPDFRPRVENEKINPGVKDPGNVCLKTHKKDPDNLLKKKLKID